MAKVNLGQQIGPLPLGAWVVEVGAGLSIAFYTRRVAKEPVAVNDTSGTPGVGTGAVGGWIPTTPGATDTPVQGPPTTNDEWAVKVINGLIAKGYPPTSVDSAVRKYIAGASADLSVSEWSLISIALATYGSPPQPLPPSGTPPVVIPPVGVPPKPRPPAPKPLPRPRPRPPTPRPAPRPTVRYYTVVRGDSLWKIAVRFYHNGALWPRIWNANRGIVHNPNRISPGQRLRIP